MRGCLGQEDPGDGPGSARGRSDLKFGFILHHFKLDGQNHQHLELQDTDINCGCQAAPHSKDCDRISAILTAIAIDQELVQLTRRGTSDESNRARLLVEAGC